jgi:glycogen(starch) synthase
MKILVISNLYPPHYIGGYELGCQQVVEALRQQGHTVKVLTSTYGLEKPAVNGETYRWLAAEPFWLGQIPVNTPLDVIQRERVNQGAFNRLCREFKPEAVYIWNAAFISISLAFIALRRKIPVLYYISDRWLSQWDHDSWISWCRKIPSSALKKAAKKWAFSALNAVGLNTMHDSLDLSRVQFTSRFIQEVTAQAGVPVAGGQVIHWGVDVEEYAASAVADGPPTRLLFVGQARKHKGVHTAIEAFALLKARNKDLPLTLTIAGGSLIREEETQLREYIASFGLEKAAAFTGMLPRSEIIPYYRSHDILIFPSIFDEPFSITLLEGLASGLAVVGTTKGGSREILEDGVNALTFPAGDAEACADRLQRLIEDPELYRKIRRNGRQTVVDQFQFKMMVDKISSALQAAQISKDAVKNPIT